MRRLATQVNLTLTLTEKKTMSPHPMILCQ